VVQAPSGALAGIVCTLTPVGSEALYELLVHFIYSFLTVIVAVVLELGRCVDVAS
jgi:hypothetical protein